MSMNFVKPTRRQFLAGSAALGAASFTGLKLAFANVDWKKYAGTTLEVNLIKSPRGDILQKYQKEFEELTGIKVNSEQTPEQQQRQKAVIELTSGKPSFDVIHISYHVQKRQFEKGGWLADLTPFLKDPGLTEPSLTESDFAEAGLAFAKDKNGRFGGLPFSVDYWMIYWNKELFAAKGVEYPTTFEELATAAETLTDRDNGIYGFVARGMKNANTPVWASLMLGYGKSTVEDGKLETATQESIDAATLYQRLMTKSAPPGVTGFNWAECQSSFLQGKVAMWLDGIGFAPPLEDPKKSRVVGKVGYGLMPKGPVAQAAATFGDGIGVTEGSANKEAAYLYCQWAISKEMGARLLQSGSGVPFRNSIVNDPEVIKGVTMPQEWAKVLSESAKVSQLCLPVIVPVTEFRDVMGVGLTNIIGGADPAEEMKRVTAEFEPILARSEG
ncbi:ABC transporter substrate-binding protein [Phyllobacterium sp. K27]